MTQVNMKTAIEKVNKAFERWGLPLRIKIDNGRPFVNPSHMDVPTLAILWWIGLGIEVIQNRPATPQENGAVEGNQGVMFRWVNPGQYHSVEQLQEGLEEVGRIHRNVYKVPAKGHQTRLTLFPELEHNPRSYDPKLFDFTKVEAYLADRAWVRTIRRNGEIKFLGKVFYLGQKHAAKQISITYDPIDHLWMFHDQKGVMIKASDAKIVDPEAIISFATLPRSDTTF